MDHDGDNEDQVKATNVALRKRGVLAPLEEDEDEEDGGRPELPAIALPGVGRQIQSSFNRELGAVLATNGVFMRGEVPMVLNREEKKLDRLDADGLVSYAEGHAMIHVYGKSRDENDQLVKIPRSMKKETANLVLKGIDFKKQQRQIRRVNEVPMPVMREDGRVELLKPGFDYDTGILTMPSKFQYKVMPLEEARHLLVEFHKDFEFKDRDEKTKLSRSLAVHVAGMLTPFCMGLLHPKALVPMFVYTANTPGSGKSLLCKIALCASYGEAAALVFGADEDELRKQLDTSALEAASYVFFDNVKRKLSSMLLDMFITQTMWAGRKMGGQSGFKVEKQCAVFVSVNHVKVDKDINRRALFCELHLETADVQSRQFDLDMDDTYLDRPEVRQDLLQALWSLVWHWAEAGRPVGPKRLVTFEEWSRVVCGIVAHAGFGDPLEKPDLDFGDTETRDMQTLVTELAKKIDPTNEENPRSHEATFEDVLDICQAKDLFVDKIDGRKKWVGDGDERVEMFEINKASRIAMGNLLLRENNKVWNVEGVGTVRFGRKGSKNARKWPVELVG